MLCFALLGACASPSVLPEQARRPNAARLLKLDKVNPGDAFARNVLTHFEAPLKCEEPPADATITRIDLLIYEGAQVSSVTLSKQSELTTSSEITIEPGTEPLILRLGSFRPNIWRIKGASDRIRKIYLGANSRDENKSPQAAVVGVSNNKILFSSDPCLLDDRRYYFLKQEQRLVDWKSNGAWNKVGMIYAYENAGISLPSASRYDYDLNRPKRFRGRKLGIDSAWSDHLWQHPRGVFEFSSKEIRHIPRVRHYQWFPGKLGVIQLLKNGALVRQADGDYRMLKAITKSVDVHPDNLILADGIPTQTWFANGPSCVVDHAGKRLSKICSWSKASVGKAPYSASSP